MKTLAKNIIDIIFPPKCISCGTFVDENGALCPACWGSINFISDPACDICHFPFEYKIEGITVCAGCMAERPVFHKAKSAFIYDDNSKKLITGFKYSDKIHTANAYASMLYRTGADIIKECDLIVPVPLHKRRLFKRRYNQSALLSYALSRKCQLPVMPDMLIRKKNTVPQTSLNRNQRLSNVRGAFGFNTKYREAVNGKNILLIDDVMTTGATIAECTKALKKSGAAKINVLTLARIVER